MYSNSSDHVFGTGLQSLYQGKAQMRPAFPLQNYTLHFLSNTLYALVTSKKYNHEEYEADLYYLDTYIWQNLIVQNTSNFLNIF